MEIVYSHPVEASNIFIELILLEVQVLSYMLETMHFELGIEKYWTFKWASKSDTKVLNKAEASSPMNTYELWEALGIEKFIALSNSYQNH